MGHFPIIRTERTLPSAGPSVYADIDVRTGAGEMAQAVSGLGKTVMDLGVQYDAMIGKTQADEAIENARMSMVDALNEMQQEDDVTKWDAIIQSHESRVAKFTPKNKRGANLYNSTLNNLRPNWHAQFTNLKAAKIEDNMIAGSINKINGLLDSATQSNMDIISQKIKTELEVRDRLSPSITRAETEKAKLAVDRNIQLSIAKKMAMNNPEATLNSIRGDKMEGLDKLTTDDILQIRNIANSSITQAKIGMKQQDDAIGEEFMKLLINKLDPTKPQLDFEMIVNSDLSPDAKIEWMSRLRTFDNYSEEELEEAFRDKGEVIADIYDKIDKGTLTDELDTMVGKGLSPVTAQRIKKEARVPYEKDTEQLFKRLFGWQPQIGFENDLSAALYERTLREWKDEIKRQDATGEKIIEIGRSIARPYFVEHLKATLLGQEDTIHRILELTFGEEPRVEKPKEEIKEEVKIGATAPFLDYAEFRDRVSELKAEDPKKAKEFWDKWIGIFRPKEVNK